jgi:hypothetical protein
MMNDSIPDDNSSAAQLDTGSDCEQDTAGSDADAMSQGFDDEDAAIF